MSSSMGKIVIMDRMRYGFFLYRWIGLCLSKMDLFGLALGAHSQVITLILINNTDYILEQTIA